MCQSPEVDSQWLAGPSPLLQSPLPLGLRDTTAPTATCRMVVVSQDMLPLPEVVGALGARLPRRALGALADLQPWGRGASEFGKKAVKLVNPDKILLPAAYTQGAVLIENHRAGVFCMAATAVRSLLIRRLV